MDQKNNQQKQVQIGTEIFDPSLPSNLDFEQNKLQEYEGKQIGKGDKYTKEKIVLPFDQLRNFTVKGKKKVQEEPQFRCGSVIKAKNVGFEVKAYDEEKSGGLKKIWESLVGYVKREIFIVNGYLYLFQPIADGYMTQGAWKLSEIFKIFVDAQEGKIRIILRLEKEEKLVTKNFQSDQFEEILAKLTEQIDKVGLKLVSE